ncbi:MAG: YaeQ family protein [Polyangiaceae bacterium]|nr:YaeQ family protein [Polyangiaceae bacterium]
MSGWAHDKATDAFRMALTATIYRWQVSVSDVDRGVYEALDLRLACHPSESLRYLITRALGYCLSYEEGIAFSKGGISSTDEPPISVRDPTGLLLAWIDVGSPSAERLHKAAKAAPRVSVFTTLDLDALRKGAQAIHKAASIQVFRIEPELVAALEARAERNLSFELTRSEGQLYVTVGSETFAGVVEQTQLADG